jgi:hypothetical protein
MENIKDIKDMPTYTCEKCARTFSQKSHYTAHQNKKIDCATKTAIKEIAQKIVDQEKEKEEEVKDKQEFKIEDLKLFEITHYFPRDKSLFILMATLKEEYDGVMNRIYDGVVSHTDDIIILEEGDELIYSDNINIVKYTCKDMKYFPTFCFRGCGNFHINHKGNYVKSITLNTGGLKKIRNAKFPVNPLIKYEQGPYPRSFIMKDFTLQEVPNPVDNPYDLLLSQCPDANGVIHPLDHKQYSSVSKDMNDVIILEEGIEVILTDRNENHIRLTVSDLEYVPLYALRNTRVSINKNTKNDIKVITFNYEISSRLVTNFTQDSIKFENGLAHRLNK